MWKLPDRARPIVTDDTGSAWKLPDRVHPVLTDEGGALLDERTGRWTHLTPTATAAVLLLLAGANADQVAAAYADRYRIPHTQAADDVTTVIQTLVDAGQLIPQEKP